QLNMRHGLFKVTDRLYQIRGFDIANMTLIEGASGLIVIDPLLSVEVARAGLELYYAHRPRVPVVAVIYSHSHADHFGGVRGVADLPAVEAGRIKIFAPQGFMEHAIAENVIAGNAMSRRAQYQFGPFLPIGEKGQVDAGLGKNLSRGEISLIAPTDVITQKEERRTIDGVDIVFHLAPGTEAPAEMHMYVPALKALNMAENVTHTMHNLLPFRGAEVRDALTWSKVIGQAMESFGEAEILLAQHHWPIWGRERVMATLAKQRDLYKYLHDQTLRLMNHGYNAVEIAEVMRLPASLAQEWHARGYYGSVSHNVKAIYQRYLGWYDANPANLHPLPPVEQGRKMVEYMGGAAALKDKARKDYQTGQYRWVAQVMSHLVFADPKDAEARDLLASAFEQMGYQAEAATWRNAYLVGAMEIRGGLPKDAMQTTVSPDSVKALSLDSFFDFLGVRLDGPRAEGRKIVTNWLFTDTGQRYALNLENAALTYVAGKTAPGADATITLTRETLNDLVLKRINFPGAVAGGRIKIDGSMIKVIETFTLFDEFSPGFEIVEPKAARR
ncbi:MAG: MBL fold metallo-hydrolase, partial [Alphaproteobacteria bacterium]|nr:MBL fold metallo-hydrolase [Alphaproteobacteria bacterium]